MNTARGADGRLARVYPDPAPRLCACGCGNNIVLKYWHRGPRVPQYLPGHRANSFCWVKWYEENKDKTFACSCGCEGVITLKPHHKHLRAPPKYLWGHSKKGKTLIEPTIGKHERAVLDALERAVGYQFLRQHRVKQYYVDGYCPALKLAVEIDEPHHKVSSAQRYDALRQDDIQRATKCVFLRIETPR